MKPYDPNSTRLPVPYYGTLDVLEELKTHVDLLASIPHQGPMFATADNDRPTTQRLLFYPKELGKALRDGIKFKKGLQFKHAPSRLCLTESELQFLQHMALNLFATVGSSVLHSQICATLDEFQYQFMKKKRDYIKQFHNENEGNPHQPQRP